MAEIPEEIHTEDGTVQLDSTSSLSSFVPIDSVYEAVQIIDENKTFNKNILAYINQHSHSDEQHRIIAVFGSQSTGKSTLLNHLFSTNFDVMNEGNRQQTTKGIWLAMSPGVTNSKTVRSNENILVMDVEGTDGRERGEDQDFERKAALFALSTSEVLIVNLWETQVGLYQGANMGLLKTVFEVNLLLFGPSKLASNDHKVLLLFVIRDHLGVTPLESLAETIKQDLFRIWDGLSKPADVAHLSFDDFFDVAFQTLSHKILQHDKFLDDIKLLGDRFTDPKKDSYLFKPYYHHDIPIEGWTMYAESCWDQIDNNKDLDLPTQQILVAKFKCDEISAACYEEFEKVIQESEIKARDSVAQAVVVDYKDLGHTFADTKDLVLENFQLLASKYNKSVFEQKRQALEEKVLKRLAEVFDIYASNLVRVSAKAFQMTLAKKSRAGKFFSVATALKEVTVVEVQDSLKLFSLGGAIGTVKYNEALLRELDGIVAKQKIVEANHIVGRALKKLNNGLSTAILDEISKPSKTFWDNVLNQFEDLSKKGLLKYENELDYDFGLGADQLLNESLLKVFEFKSWSLFHDLLRKFLSKESLTNILRDRFDERFRYDENGVPKLYRDARELEVGFTESRDIALEAFPILSFAKLTNGTELRPKYNIFDNALRRKYESVQLSEREVRHGGAYTDEGMDDSNDYDDDDDDDDEEAGACFAEILDEHEKSEVLSKFKREVDARFVEAKRSIMQSVTLIPYYIYIVILVLGWNEFMAIIRNPFFFTLLLFLAAGVYVLHLMSLLGPALLVVRRMGDEAVAVAKEKLREFIVEDHGTHAANLGKMAGNSKSSEPHEEIEMSDLSNESS